MTGSDPTAAAKNLAETAKISLEVVEKLLQLSVSLKTLFAKAVSMPSEARTAVEEIFEEVEKSVFAVDKAARSFLDALDDPDAFLDDRDKVYEMSGPYLPMIVENGRGHCETIGHLNYQFLMGRLDRFFPGKKEKSSAAESLLAELANGDENLFKILVTAAEKMQNVAREALKLDIQGKRDEAKDLLLDSAFKMIDLRDDFNDALVKMAANRREFVNSRHPDMPKFEDVGSGDETAGDNSFSF